MVVAAFAGAVLPTQHRTERMQQHHVWRGNVAHVTLRLLVRMDQNKVCDAQYAIPVHLQPHDMPRTSTWHLAS